MRRPLALVLALIAVAAPHPTPAQSASAPDVDKGVREVEENELDAAIFTLDTAARRLAGDPAMARELARAYLYLGIAFVGKTQETLAKARFRDALQQQRDLSLSPERFSPKVIAVFEAARAELAQAAASTAPSPPPPAPAPKKAGSKAPLILTGVGGAAAVGTVLALAGGSGEPSEGDARRLVTVGPEELALFARREVDVTPSAAGTLEAQVTWTEPTANLILYLDEAGGGISIAVSERSATPARTKQISAPVTARAYKVGLFHCQAGCTGTPLSTTSATFTLQIKVP